MYVLYHFLPELKELSQNGLSAEDSKEHSFNLGKICQYLEQAYKVTTDRVESVIRGRYISYDLLWAFFKPESLLYCSCPATDLPRCIRYIEGYTQRPNYHEDKEFFKIRASFLNFDGGSVREILKTYEIEKFNGRKRLEDLPIYPLHYYLDQGIKKFLISRGQKFISIASRRCHRRYSGNIFFEPEGGPTEIKLAKKFVDGRIMVDSAAFRKMVPRYTRLRSESPASYGIFRSSGGDGLAKIAGPDCLDPQDLQDEDLLICSPTVLGFALDGKIWEVEEIEFSTSSFGKVLIPEKQKDVILSLTASHLASTSDKGFGDIIDGKGRGIIILLHGPPGVGKTVTAEALADHLRRPLYSVSAGNMGEKAEEFEAELTRMFRIASDWGSILLIDEADTFLQRRDQNPQHNRIVATFLRTLEYFDGILFLTTNFVNNFDKAILDRVHLKVRYEGLDPSKRKDIFTHFLQLINATVEDADLTRFCEVRLNGRQVRVNSFPLGIGTDWARDRYEI
ncbi:hypothetical protein DPV78_009829 [Talaromyces pinophilus]|nr:hypothetical protein DPV78_009829 [Talaromyces pinophilus]